MSIRRQINVSLPLDVAERLEKFARVFHGGEVARVARVLIEEGLVSIQDEGEYLAALKRRASGGASQPVIQQSLETDRKVIEAHAKRKRGREKAG